MDLRKLGYFVAVADHGGFTNAAKAVYASQPAVSLAIKELEQELGTPLFFRLGRSVTLTPAGQALLGPARQTLRDAETAAVADVVGLRAGSLSLCSLPTLAADPLADLVGRFRRAYPEVTVDLAAPDDTAELVELLRVGTSEMGLTEGVALPDELVQHELVVQRLLIVLPPGTETEGDVLALTALEQTPLIAAPRGTSSRRLLDAGFAQVGRQPKVVVVTAQREAILPLVLSGAGGALVPEPLADMARRLGALVALPRPAITRRVVLAHRRGPLAPAAERFIELALSRETAPAA